MALDAVVVGAGPNGLAAALTLTRAGRSVRVVEAAATPGGNARSAELTLPGHVHDVGAAIVPLTVGSPFFRALDLGAELTLVHPDIPLAHPLDGGRGAILDRSVDATAAGLGQDAGRWRWLVGPLARRWDRVIPDVLGPVVRVPSDPIGLLQLGVRGAPPARAVRHLFQTEEARALFAGSAAHAFLPLERPGTSTFGLLLLASGHAVGWPSVRGGTGRLIDAMAHRLEREGVEIVCGAPVASMADVPRARAVLFDVNPAQLLRIAGPELPARYRARLAHFRHGPGVFKLDYALSEPVPWTNADCRRAGTVHVGGGLDEIAAAELAVWRGVHPERPFVIVAQQSIFDVTRAPAGAQTLWAYTHVPHGSRHDITDAVERQIERFAPGFRETVVARHRADPAWFSTYNANAVGGDILGGSQGGLQLVRRPTLLHPHRTPNPRLFLCSSSTPPGGGVHGMCGLHAARAALAGILA
ncbi:MAG: phytoene desaturase family protein [Miltoncostaeaceae bacterium]